MQTTLLTSAHNSFNRKAAFATGICHVFILTHYRRELQKWSQLSECCSVHGAHVIAFPDRLGDRKGCPKINISTRVIGTTQHVPRATE